MEHRVISREEAHKIGLRRFYTGKPCKNGHYSQRYVSTNGCIECQQKTFRFRVNAFNRDLAPFQSSRLWTLRGYSAEQNASLERYLQEAIFAHARHHGMMTPELEEAARLQLERTKW